MTRLIYHLAEAGDLADADEVYRAASLYTEGFIHCSEPHQVDDVARDLYPDRNDLTILTIDLDALGDTVAYEDLYEIGQEFPHVYGAIPTRSIIDRRPYLKHLEEALWRPETRFDPDWMKRVLHPQFEEFGASGKHHSRQATLDVVPQPIDATLPLAGYQLDVLSDTVALARYLTRVNYDGVAEAARRSSVWVLTPVGWQLRFHQGTPIPKRHVE